MKKRTIETLPPSQLLRLTETVQMIGLCASLIQVAFQDQLVDSRFLNSALNNHARLIKQSSEAIQRHLASVSTIKDREFFNYEYCAEFFELVKTFIGHDIDQLRALNKAIEESKTGNKPIEVTI